jgi:hypothetical protein
MIRMIVEVVKDMRAFSFIFLIVLLAAANVFFILDVNAVEF